MKPGDFVIPKRNILNYWDTRKSYKVVSISGKYLRVICDDGVVRGIYEGEFYPIDDGEEEFGGPDESFF